MSTIFSKFLSFGAYRNFCQQKLYAKVVLSCKKTKIKPITSSCVLILFSLLVRRLLTSSDNCSSSFLIPASSICSTRSCFCKLPWRSEILCCVFSALTRVSKMFQYFKKGRNRNIVSEDGHLVE